ncbi:MAG: DksA/TraR family C4-type zinc finger protein [Gammaproteobacteria bacterium]
MSGNKVPCVEIDASIKDAIKQARSEMPAGESLTHCEECEEIIPEARRLAIVGVRFCVNCQTEHDKNKAVFSGYNRRGSKDSQLR